MICTVSYCDIHDYTVAWPWCAAATPRREFALLDKPTVDSVTQDTLEVIADLLTDIRTMQGPRRAPPPPSRDPVQSGAALPDPAENRSLGGLNL